MSRFNPAIVVAAGAIAFLSAAGAPRAEQVRVGAGAIAATVRDAQGKAVPGALVVADGPTIREATTGVAGVVTLQALPVGTYSVRVTRAGYEPSSREVSIGAHDSVPTILSLSIATAGFADLTDMAANGATASARNATGPYVIHTLEASPGVDIVRSGSDSGMSPSLAGTSAGETRVEMDGIPIAGGSSAFPALRFRTATALDDVEIAPSPGETTSTVRDAIGGVVNYRTPSIENAAGGTLELGYDSAFGSYQHALFTQTSGKIGLLADVITGGGENRSQILKGRYTLSPGVSLGFASYGSQSTATIDDSNVNGIAPGYSADLKAALGTGTLAARTFSSQSRTDVEDDGVSTSLEDARVRGFQLGYDLPSGENIISLAFDRRTETASFDAGLPTLAQTFTTFTARANLQISHSTRLELGDAFSGGTLLPSRHDPQLALAWRPVDRFTLRLAAGSAFATAPDDVLQAHVSSPAGLAPETSFAYRVAGDAVLGPTDHAWFSAFQLRRFDTFGSQFDARGTGVEVGFEKTAPAAAGLGALASVDLVRSTSFGGAQPLARTLGSISVAADDQLAGIPYSKARFALSYGTKATELRFGTTWLGANNALATHGLVLGDASVRFTFASIARVQVGIQNLFGVSVTDPLLQPLYRPHELNLLVNPTFRL